MSVIERLERAILTRATVEGRRLQFKQGGSWITTENPAIELGCSKYRIHPEDHPKRRPYYKQIYDNTIR